jgi:cytochrome c-type biogenesis protein CcmH
MKYRTSFLILIILLAGITALPAWAQETDPDIPSDDDVNAIAEDLYCPVCENIPLDACGTQACVQWRDLIREKLAQGWTEEEIKTYFVNQYGDRVLAEPPRRGLNWLVYLVPPVVFLVGAYLLFKGLRNRTLEAETPDSLAEDSVDETYIARLEEELRQQD